ncbi:MAG: hypothetical protein ACK4UJ_02100 [Leptonema sp. (in: bacteria)]
MVNLIIKFFKTHWQAKIVSVVLAILFSFYVEYSKTIKKTFYIKVEPPNLPNHLVFSEEIPAFMKVDFYGAEDTINIEQTSFKLHLVNTGPGPGKNKFRLELIPPPPKSIQVQIEFPEIEILVDTKKRKALPLIPNLILQNESKKIVYWNFNPNFMVVEGPEKLFNTLDRIYLNKTILFKNSSIFFSKVLVSELPKFVKLVENQPFEIPLEVKYLSEAEMEEKVKNIPLEFQIFEEELEVFCTELPETLELETIPKVKVTYISRNLLNKNFLKAVAFCPVEYNINLQIIEPSPIISKLPVQIHMVYDFKDFEILKMEPLFVDFQFKLKRKPFVNQQEKGLQEHIIR